MVSFIVVPSQTLRGIWILSYSLLPHLGSNYISERTDPLCLYLAAGISSSRLKRKP